MIKRIYTSWLFYPLVLVLICLFIAFKNYTPGTFLTGWDTLHPEFNFPLNFQRLFAGVWRPEQGFGAVSGHSAMADLPRVFILWLFHFIFPLSFLRYSYIFLCLLLGPLGVYFFINHLFKKQSLLSFLVALFYLLNLSTLQQFYVPFEMFPTQWAFLPWVMLFALQYLTAATKKSLFLFSLFTLFSTPQAYAAHLWYPFFGAFVLFLTLHFLLNRHSLRHYFSLLVLVLAINSFWLLPNLYYLKTSSAIPRQNQQNRLHSQEYLLENRQTGNLVDSPLARGFYFNWNIYNFTTEEFQQLMPQWRQHLTNFDIQIIGYSLFIASLLGLIIAFIKKDRRLLPFSPFFIIPFILLTNNIPPFSWLFELLLKIPLLSEVLRFVFTKVSVLFIFGQVIFFASFIIWSKRYLSFKFTAPLVVVALLIYTAPFFSGQLISPQVRVNIPDSYFNFWKFMSSKPNGRILALPLHDPAGWTYTSWGYQGSGLIWFGLPQSITDRDNDRWQPINEEAYREFRAALYSGDSDRFQRVLTKYKIDYLLWDKNTVSTSPKNQEQITTLYYLQKSLGQLQANNMVTAVSQFDNLNLYQVSSLPPVVELGHSLPQVSPSYHWQFQDDAFIDRDYLTLDSALQNSSSVLPFRDILTLDNRLDLSKATLSESSKGWDLKLLNQSPIHLTSLSYSAKDIYQLSLGAPNLKLNPVLNSLTVYTQDDSHGFSLPLDQLPHQSSYIVGINSGFISGLPLRFCFKDPATGLCLVEDELSRHSKNGWDFFLIPASDQFFGYQIDVNAVSFAQVLSQTQVNRLVIMALPNSFLTKINTPTFSTPAIPNTPITSTSYLNSSLYSFSLPKLSPDDTLILNQSYNPDWFAFYFKNNQPIFIKNHLLINNWANGWKLPSISQNTTIFLFFWPTLLEFIGFISVIFSFIWVLTSRHKNIP